MSEQANKFVVGGSFHILTNCSTNGDPFQIVAFQYPCGYFVFSENLQSCGTWPCCQYIEINEKGQAR